MNREMTNDECRMTKSKGEKLSVTNSSFEHSDFFRHSSFVLRHFPDCTCYRSRRGSRWRENHPRNFPLRIICSPSNQMSKSRPTQSMCVFELQLAPVCSA